MLKFEHKIISLLLLIIYLFWLKDTLVDNPPFMNIFWLQWNFMCLAFLIFSALSWFSLLDLFFRQTSKYSVPRNQSLVLILFPWTLSLGDFAWPLSFIYRLLIPPFYFQLLSLPNLAVNNQICISNWPLDLSTCICNGPLKPNSSNSCLLNLFLLSILHRRYVIPSNCWFKLKARNNPCLFSLPYKYPILQDCLALHLKYILNMSMFHLSPPYSKSPSPFNWTIATTSKLRIQKWKG